MALKIGRVPLFVCTVVGIDPHFLVLTAIFVVDAVLYHPQKNKLIRHWLSGGEGSAPGRCFHVCFVAYFYANLANIIDRTGSKMSKVN